MIDGLTNEMTRFSKCCWVLSLSFFLLEHANADGLVFRLPPDGSWVAYGVREQGQMTIALPDGTVLGAGTDEGEQFPLTVTGRLVVRSVGRQTVDDVPCRWIEIESQSKMTGEFPGPNGEHIQKEDSRHFIHKMLIPEEHCRAGADPLSHVVTLYIKDDDKDAELVDGEKARQYELDRLRPRFPAPGRAVETSRKNEVLTLHGERRELNCNLQIFDSQYEGPLTRGTRGWWSWTGKHELSLHESVPCGVAALRHSFVSHEWSGDKKKSAKLTVRGETELIATAYGSDATSALNEEVVPEQRTGSKNR